MRVELKIKMSIVQECFDFWAQNSYFAWVDSVPLKHFREITQAMNF